MKATATLLTLRRITPTLAQLFRLDQEIKLNWEFARLRHFKHRFVIR